MATVTSSKQFTINLRDVVKGLTMAVILPVLTIIQNSISEGSLTFNWKLIGLTAAGGFVAYIIKNWLTPAEIVVSGVSNDTINAIKDGAATVEVKQ